MKNQNFKKSSYSDLTLARCSTQQLLDLDKERKFFSHEAVRLHFGRGLASTVLDVLLRGQHGIIGDELLALFYCTIAKNTHIDMVALLSDKFSNLLPANTLVITF